MHRNLRTGQWGSQDAYFYKVESTPTSIAAGDLNGGGVPVKQLYSINTESSPTQIATSWFHIQRISAKLF